MSRRHQIALSAIARRYRVRIFMIEGAARSELATAAGEGAFAVKPPRGPVLVLHAAEATVADVRRCARRAAQVFGLRRGLLPDDRARELASLGVQGHLSVDVALRAWDRAKARRGWAS